MGKGSSPPPDRSVELRQLELDAEERRREQQRIEEAAERERLTGLRNNATASARSSASDFFTQRGLDASEFASPIERELQEILTSISPDDTTPGVHFNNFGQRVFDEETNAARARHARELDRFAGVGFANSRIGNDLDDPVLAAIQAEQRSEAEQVLRNMFDRGVITQTGFDAGIGDLNKQAFGVNDRLNEIGLNTLEQGRQGLRDIASQGREAAQGFELGGHFDSNMFRDRIDNEFTDFLTNLGGRIRSQTQGNLFDTSGLAGIAGAAQGAQNTPFSSNPGAPIQPPKEDDEEQDRRTSSTSVF